MRTGAILVALLIVGPRAEAQVVDRARAEAEAAGQASEADRLFKLGEWEPALALYEAEQASRAALGDAKYEAYALRAIGICRAELGDDEAALASWARARALDLKRDDPGYAGYDDFLAGQAMFRLGRIVEGVATLERALPLLSGASDRDHEADARLALARTLVALGRSEQARAHVDRAIGLAEGLGDSARLADAWASSSGQVEGALGHYSIALERFSDARVLFEDQGRAADAAWMETVSGSTLALMGRPALALRRFEEAARLHEHLEDGGSLSEDLAAIAGLDLEAGRVDESLAHAGKAVEAAARADDRGREVEARVRLAQAQGRKGNWAAASSTMDEAVGLIRQVARDDPAEQIRVLLTAAAIDRKAGLAERAASRLDAARSAAEESGLPPLREMVEAARRAILAEPGPPPPR